MLQIPLAKPQSSLRKQYIYSGVLAPLREASGVGVGAVLEYNSFSLPVSFD
jgi:hypothetical protein